MEESMSFGPDVNDISLSNYLLGWLEGDDKDIYITENY